MLCIKNTIKLCLLKSLSTEKLKINKGFRKGTSYKYSNIDSFSTYQQYPEKILKRLEKILEKIPHLKEQ